MLRLSLVLVLSIAATRLAAAAPDGDAPAVPTVMPRPAEMKVEPGAFTITESTAILVKAQHPDAKTVAEYLADWLRARTGYPVPVRDLPRGGKSDPHIILAVAAGHPGFDAEYYALTVTPEKLALFAPQPRGLFRGVQTIRQLLPPDAEKATAPDAVRPAVWQVPCVRINDQPRYHWRGMLLDCGRHFMTKDFIKRYIDLLAYHKMNVLHWHLTEDQGWRIEIKKYPKLTEVGAWRKATRNSELTADPQGRYGGFYTQEDVKEIVAYAASRYITIVPEIELPGHCVAALASYPELSCTGGPFEVSTRWGVHEDVYCAGNEKTFEFLEDVLSEVCELFPSEFIHIGGDECPKQRWKACPRCQARIKAEGLQDEHELQSYFIRRIERFLSSKGKRLVGWDEILEGGLAPNATVQSWRGLRGAIAAATAGHDVISSPTSHCYLDYAQARLPGEPTWMGFLSLERVYSFEPTPAELSPEQARHVLGLEGNMWTEHAPQPRVDWQAFPRLCALAEVAWTPQHLRDWADFSRRLQHHYRRLDALGVEYFIDPPTCASPGVFTAEARVIFEKALSVGRIHYTLDGSEPTEKTPELTQPLTIRESTRVKTRTVLDNGRMSDVAEFYFRKLQPLEPIDVPNATPGLRCEYFEGDWRKLPDFDTLTPAAAGSAATFDLTPRKRDSHYALRFTGYLEVSAGGTYTFHVHSDDGSRLWIGSEPVVNHDGLHAASEASGQVMLKPGRHPIRVEFFQAGGAQKLKVSYEGPGLEMQPIPAAALSHAAHER